jgi:hypothetical protein
MLQQSHNDVNKTSVSSAIQLDDHLHDVDQAIDILGGVLRGTGLENRAAIALEADVLNHARLIQLGIHRKLVPAQRVLPQRIGIGRFQHLKIPGLLVVLQNDLLIKLVVVRHEYR